MVTESSPSTMVMGLKENEMRANEPPVMSKVPDTLARPEISPPPSPCQLSNRNVPVNSPVWSSADRGNDMLPPDPSKIVLSIVTTVLGRAREEEFVRTQKPPS